MDVAGDEKGPTRRQVEVLGAYLWLGSWKQASHALGISPSSVHNHLTRLYERLDVDNAIGAATKLGWLTVPHDLRPSVRVAA